MPFNIIFSPEALDHLQGVSARNRRIVVAQIAVQLASEPSRPSRNRKRLRPNLLATWELRVGDQRVFYDVDSENLRVDVIAVGVKQRSRLLIGGEEFEL